MIEWFTKDILYRVVISAVFILAAFVLYKIISVSFKRGVKKRNITKNNAVLMRKALRYLFFISVVIILVLLWGGNLENFWISIVGILGLTAVAFFAAWSFLSNVVAGLILLFSKSFNLGEEVEVMPEGVTGTVKAVGLMFVVLEDTKGNVYQIPNNLLMQKVVKTLKK